MTDTAKYKKFLATILDESEDNPASRDGQQRIFENAFYKLTGAVSVNVDPKLVAAFNLKAARYIEQRNTPDDSETSEEYKKTKERLSTEYRSGKMPLDLATELLREVDENDISFERIGCLLSRLQYLVWPSDLLVSEDDPEIDPIDYTVDQDEQRRHMSDIQELLYDPAESVNLCASNEDAYIAAGQLEYAANQARNMALGNGKQPVRGR